MSEQTNETTCPHCGGPGCEVCSWTGTVLVDPSRRRQRAPGDGSAAVPSEPRRWTIKKIRRANRKSDVNRGATVPLNNYFFDGFISGPDTERVMVEEVGPVSGAEVEAGARALASRIHWLRDDERATELARAVLSAAREVGE